MFLQRKKYQTYDDEQLIIAYQKSGDSAILGTLYKRHSHKVLGLCLNYLKNLQDSEDALMEIFIQLSEDLKKYQIDKFEPWLFFVCRNYCLKKFKKALQQKNEDINEISLENFMEFPEEKDHNKEEARLEAVSDAINSLKEDQRQCIILFFLEKKSYKEIAEMTTFSINEIKSHIQNGKRNLKNQLIS